MAVLYCLSGSGCLPPETGPVVGKIFYLDPVAGSMDGDGSAAHPWASLEEVIAAGLIRTHAYADYPWDEDDPLYVRNPDGLVQAGQHETLLAEEGIYRELYENFIVQREVVGRK